MNQALRDLAQCGNLSPHHYALANQFDEDCRDCRKRLVLAVAVHELGLKALQEEKIVSQEHWNYFQQAEADKAAFASAFQVLRATLVPFNEGKQEFYCRVCRYRDPLGPDGSKLHDDDCPLLAVLTVLESGAASAANQLSALAGGGASSLSAAVDPHVDSTDV